MTELGMSSAWGRRLWTALNLPLVAAALVWRRVATRATVIAVSGSRGKTTTKDLLARILDERGPTTASFGTENGRHGLPRTVLAIGPRTRYGVVEVGIDGPGLMWRGALVVQPTIVVMTCVADEHVDRFADEDAIAAEKRVLVESLGPEGVAVLNADDHRVAAMASAARGRVVRFGESAEAEIRGEGVSAVWPERLRLDVQVDGERLRLQTQLVGEHWAPSVLAALAGAYAAGVPAAEAVSAMEGLAPVPSRLEPVTLDSGAVLLRDEYNGSIGTLDAALTVMEQARAERRVAILSDFTDDDRSPELRLGDVARRVAKFADLAVFVGAQRDVAAQAALAAGMVPEQVKRFGDFQACADYLRDELREGDLALLKGRNADHLGRIYWRMVGPVACERDECPLRILCEDCPELHGRAG